MRSQHLAKVIYISYNGLEDALVQSQVLPYLRVLRSSGWAFSLITFERGSAPSPEQLLEADISWHPVAQASGPVGAITAIMRASTLLKRLLSADHVSLVHARSYVPAYLAKRVSRKQQVPWLFDMRGFWVDEKVMKGTLKQKSMIYGFFKKMERKMLRSADGIVSLTQKALPGIGKIAEFETWPPVSVIPTCVDLERFTLASGNQASGQGRLVFGYVGSVGAGYDAVLLVEYLTAALNKFESACALIVTRSDPRELASLSKRFPERVTIRSAGPDQMPALVQSMDVGLSFITAHTSKDASCPTKLAEYLACGAVVVSNRGIGDVDELLAQKDVGVLVDGADDFEASFVALELLLSDPTIKQRCRARTEGLFSVVEGAQRYDQIYRTIAHEPSQAS